MIEVLQAPEQEVCLTGCDKISVTYKLIGEEPVTVEVEKVDGSFTFDGYELSCNGGVWSVVGESPGGSPSGECCDEYIDLTLNAEIFGGEILVRLDKINETTWRGNYEAYDIGIEYFPPMSGGPLWILYIDGVEVADIEGEGCPFGEWRILEYLTSITATGNECTPTPTTYATLTASCDCAVGTYTLSEGSIFESFLVAPVCFTSKWHAVHHPIKWQLQRKDAIVIGTTDNSGLFRLELSASPPTGVQIGTAVDFYDTLGVKRSSVVNDISGNFIRVSTTIVFGVTVAFVIFPQLYTNYYIETSIMRNGTDEVTTLRTIPFRDGQATVDVHSALKTLALYDNTFNYTSLTAFDLGMSGKYKLKFRECYNFTKQAYGSLTAFYYWSNSAKQIRDLYGSNMAEYVGNLATPAKFLTVFDKPTNFIGFPFSLSWINGGDYTKLIRRNENNGTYTALGSITSGSGAVQRLKVSDACESVLIEYGIPDFFGAFLKQGELTETKQIKIHNDCIQNPVCLSWLNTLGGREHWVFGYNQSHGLDTSQGATFEPYINDLQEARSNIFDLEKFAQPTMTLNAVVDIEDIEGLKTILYSICVEMLVNGKWIGVRPQVGSFFIRETRDTNAEIEFTIDTPYINIQVR